MASLEFERPLLELERRIAELESAITAAGPTRPGLQAEVGRLKEKARQLQVELFSGLSTWRVARGIWLGASPHKWALKGWWCFRISMARCSVTGATA